MPSKLGPHINFVREADAMRDFLLTARPAVAKAVNPDPVFWAEIKQEAPEIFLIGRKFFDGQPWGDANRVAHAILDMGAVRIMDAWEGLNEPSRDKLDVACRMDRKVAEILHREAIRYVCGSWPVGVPDIRDWTKGVMLDALRVADYIGVHEYDAPIMGDPRGMDADGTGWFVARYLKWYPELPADCQKPLLITECGIDSGAPGGHWDPGAQGGWQSFTNAQGYMGQLAWYDAILETTPYVKGALIYQWGSLNPKWDSYDTTPELQALLRDYIISQREGEPDPDPIDWESQYHAAQSQLELARWKLDRMHQILHQ